MKLNFKQGIITHQTDLNDNPTFLQIVGAGVSLIVSPDVTLLTFSHGDEDYLFEENQTINSAWSGPFPSNQDHYLFWDIDMISGERTFGSTTIRPVVSQNQPGPVQNRHWFDTQSKQMKVYTGRRYVVKLRVFAAVLESGGNLVPYVKGTQVSLNTPSVAGVILFDDDNKPVKKFNRFGRGHFITTETPLSSQFSRLINFKLENSLHDGKATEFIPKYSCVTFKTQNSLSLAKYIEPDHPCIGVSSEDMFIGEAKNFITSGYIKNDLWNWVHPPGTLLFVGPTGEITTDVPQSFSIQNIGRIVTPQSIYVDIKQLIKLI